jgi:hypothetical protein
LASDLNSRATKPNQNLDWLLRPLYELPRASSSCLCTVLDGPPRILSFFGTSLFLPTKRELEGIRPNGAWIIPVAHFHLFRANPFPFSKKISNKFFKSGFQNTKHSARFRHSLCRLSSNGLSPVYYIWDAQPLLTSVVGWSIAFAVFYIFLGTRSLYEKIAFTPGEIIGNFSPLKYIAAAGLFIGTRLIIKILSNGTSGYGMKFTLLHTIFQRGIIQPGLFFIAAIIFFGPFLWLSVFYWNRVCKYIWENFGFGMTLYAILSLLLSLTSESRQSISFLPVVVLLTLLVIDDSKFKNSHLGLFAALAVLYSKVWLPLPDQPPMASVTEFPFERMMLNFGPWINTQMYLVQTLVVLATGALLFYIYGFSRQDNTSSVISDR